MKIKEIEKKEIKQENISKNTYKKRKINY